MTKDAIIAAIDAKIGDTDHRIWCIGITNDPSGQERYWSGTEKKKTFFWTHWQADSLLDAQEVKSYFVAIKGMREGSNGAAVGDGSIFIYVF